MILLNTYKHNIHILLCSIIHIHNILLRGTPEVLALLGPAGVDAALAELAEVEEVVVDLHIYVYIHTYHY